MKIHWYCREQVAVLDCYNVNGKPKVYLGFILNWGRPTLMLSLTFWSKTKEWYCRWDALKRRRDMFKRWLNKPVNWMKEWDRKFALHHARQKPCLKIAEEYWRYDDHIVVECGSWGIEGEAFCDNCMKVLSLEYPQGWSYYPGDVCPHGTYVGGCGVDWMCAACEGGY